MTIILHVGFPKTATTALQQVFFDNQEVMRDSGILYPIVDKDFKQRYFKNFLTSKITMKAAMSADAKSKLAAFGREVSEFKGAAILISCEELTNELDFDLNAKSLEELATFLRSFGREIVVVAYARNPVEYYLSRMQERLKSRGGIIRPAVFESRTAWAISQYTTALGASARVRAFARGALKDGSITADFFDLISDIVQVPTENLQEKIVNESLSAEVMFALDFLHSNSEVSGKPRYSSVESRALWRYLQRIDIKGGASGKPRLYQCAAEAVAEAAQEDVRDLAEHYSLSYKDHYLPLNQENPLERNAWLASVEEIVSVDRSRAFRLIASVAEKGVKALATPQSIRPV